MYSFPLIVAWLQGKCTVSPSVLSIESGCVVLASPAIPKELRNNSQALDPQRSECPGVRLTKAPELPSRALLLRAALLRSEDITAIDSLALQNHAVKDKLPTFHFPWAPGTQSSYSWVWYERLMLVMHRLMKQSHRHQFSPAVWKNHRRRSGGGRCVFVVFRNKIYPSLGSEHLPKARRMAIPLTHPIVKSKWMSSDLCLM